MAVVLLSRNLRSAPSADPSVVITPPVIAPAGKKVDIIDTNPSFLKIHYTDGGQVCEGWVPALTIKRDADEIGGPLDKLVFAETCVRRAISWGASAHYLMAVAEMRTSVTDGPNKNAIDTGPFALSADEWAFYTGLPDYDLGMTPSDIVNWRSQCSVFSVMILTAQQNIAGLIDSQPTYSQLYLAQILGSKAAAEVITNPARAIADVLGATSPDSFKADGVNSARIQDRYGDLLNGATGDAALKRIDAALQPALDATNPFIIKVAGDTIDTPPSESGPAPEPAGDETFAAAAAALGPGVQVAMIRAFAEVESGGKSGFGKSGLPIIAFEGHIFRRYTKGVFDSTNPQLSYRYKMKAGPEWQANNKNQDTAWQTLRTAMALNNDAALLACSWGMFQVMGFNFKMCGYPDVNAFVAKMKSQKGQVDAFIGFCKATNGLAQALADKNFVKCATLYNGQDFGDYPARIEKAFKKFGGT